MHGGRKWGSQVPPSDQVEFEGSVIIDSTLPDAMAVPQGTEGHSPATEISQQICVSFEGSVHDVTYHHDRTGDEK